MKMLAITLTMVSLVGAYVVPQILSYFQLVTEAFQGLGY